MFQETSSHSSLPKGQCRFGLPYKTCESTHIDVQTGRLVLQRNQFSLWMNAYCYLISSAFRCNHDWKFLPHPDTLDLLALLYYLTNYSTKVDLDLYNVADLIATAHEKLMKELQTAPCTERYWAERMLFRTINLITGKKEVSAQQCVNELLGYEDEIISDSFRNFWIGYYLDYIEIRDHQNLFQSNSSEVTLEVQVDTDDPKSIPTIASTSNNVEDYLHRGRHLHHLSPYQYHLSYSRTKINKNSLARSHYKYDDAHPMRNTHIQVQADKLVIEKTSLCIIGPNYDSLTDTEFAMLVLTLFTPWTKSKT